MAKMSTLEALKKRRKSTLEKIQSKVKSTQKKSYRDDRIWKPGVDQSGNGFAVVRLLPQKEVDGTPWAHYWDHFFQGPTGKWYVEYSLSTWNQNDPVYEENRKLWNSGTEENKSIARKRGRKCHYISNILVIKDPIHPENEGKVFLYDYGVKMFEKINFEMGVSTEKNQESYGYEDDKQEYNPFDLWDGSDLKIRTSTIKGQSGVTYRNYDKSEFSKQNPLFDGDDKKLEELMDKIYDLSEFTSKEKHAKPFDELQRKLYGVLGIDANSVNQELDQAGTELIESNMKSAPEPMASAEAAVEANSTDAKESESEDFDYKAMFADDDDDDS